MDINFLNFSIFNPKTTQLLSKNKSLKTRNFELMQNTTLFYKATYQKKGEKQTIHLFFGDAMADFIWWC